VLDGSENEQMTPCLWQFCYIFIGRMLFLAPILDIANQLNALVITPCNFIVRMLLPDYS